MDDTIQMIFLFFLFDSSDFYSICGLTDKQSQEL